MTPETEALLTSALSEAYTTLLALLGSQEEPESATVRNPLLTKCREALEAAGVEI